MNKEKMPAEIKKAIKKFIKENSTPVARIKIDEAEYKRLENLEWVLPAQVVLKSPYCGKNLILSQENCLQKVLEKLPENYSARAIECDNNKYPEGSFVGEIYTTQNIGLIPENTVVCIFTVYGQLKFFEHLSCFVLWENDTCFFKLNTYEELLAQHEQSFTKKLFEYSDDGKVKSKLAESFIEHSAKHRETKDDKEEFKITYFNDDGEIFAKSCKLKDSNDESLTLKDYKLLIFPSISEISDFMKETKPNAVALAMVNGFLESIYSKNDSYRSLTYVDFLPENITFKSDAIYQDETVLVDYKRTIPEVIDDIFNVCKSSDIQLNIKDFMFFEKHTHIDLSKELVALYTNLSVNSDDYYALYDNIFYGSEKDKRSFLQSEFLKQAIGNAFVKIVKDSSLAYKKPSEKTKTSVIIDMIDDFEIKPEQFEKSRNSYNIKIRVKGSYHTIGCIAFDKNRWYYKFHFYPNEIDKLADILFADICFEELFQEYFSPDTSFTCVSKRKYKTNALEDWLGNNKRGTYAETKLYERMVAFGEMKLPFGKAKNFPGITIAEAYKHPALYRWFEYICTKKKEHSYEYTGDYPTKMRGYYDLAKRFKI